jgi:hypothetical protein
VSSFIFLYVFYRSFLFSVALLILILVPRWFLLSRDRQRTEWMLVVTLFSIPCSALGVKIVQAMSLLRPLKYDLYAYQIDRVFGEPGFWIGRMVVPHPGVMALLRIAYGFLFVALLGTFAANLWLRPLAEAQRVLETFLLNMLLATGIYLFIPVCGPGYAFPSFPQLPSADLHPLAIALSAPPNGIPSVHMSSALLVLWFLRHWWWGRTAGLVFLVLTVLSTLGCGEHYFVDLLCAIPYAAFVLWLTTPGRTRASIRVPQYRVRGMAIDGKPARELV